MSQIGQDLIESLRKVAAANPSFIYQGAASKGGQGCVYVRDGQPSCIVGKAAWNIGLIDAGFEKTSANGDDVHGLVDQLELELDEEELTWLAYAQNEQDLGLAWGNVPAAADQYIAESNEE